MTNIVPVCILMTNISYKRSWCFAAVNRLKEKKEKKKKRRKNGKDKVSRFASFWLCLICNLRFACLWFYYLTKHQCPKSLTISNDVNLFKIEIYQENFSYGIEYVICLHNKFHSFRIYFYQKCLTQIIRVNWNKVLKIAQLINYLQSNFQIQIMIALIIAFEGCISFH